MKLRAGYKTTGEAVDSPKEDCAKCTSNWYAKHDWDVSLNKVEALASQTGTKTVYLCGTASSRRAVMKLSSMVIGLMVEEDVLRERIATRKNSFGKQQHELDKIMAWRPGVEEDDRKAGAIIVNTNRPLNEVVDEILKITRGHS